jgi:acyl transferase domain-containing protein
MGDSGTRDYTALLKQALLEIKELRAELDEARRPASEPVAIIGMGCRFPGGAESPETYWRLLRDGVDAVGDVPADRWDRDADFGPDWVSPDSIHTRRGGFLDGIDMFDADFFALPSAEAAHMDPQQRLLLEVAWETFENAGLPPARLAGSRTAVFLGITNQCDFYKSLRRPAARSGTGISNCVAANRLSYFFDLKGPSLALDTACSSALVGLHLACQSLRAGDSDMALVAGVNAILSPEWMVAFSMTGMLSADGCCKSFDASANGFVRSEGCAAVLVKRLSDARRDGDRVMAVIRGTAVNQDGRSSALTVPHGSAQRSVISAALEQSGVSPAAIGYVEAHGIGSEMGDPIEVAALKAVLGTGRSSSDRCWIGSAKANIGHSEAASGLSGLIKTVMMFRHGVIPPQLHLQTLNPNLELEGTTFAVPTRLEAWVGAEEPRRACVNSFGIGGTNGHVVVEEPPPPPLRTHELDDPPSELVVLSAKSEPALRLAAARLGRYLDQRPEIDLRDLAFTAATGRTHFHQRAGFIATDLDSLREQLTMFSAEAPDIGIHRARKPGQDPPKVAFLFGDGSFDPQVGSLRQIPAFGAALAECADCLRAIGTAEGAPNPELDRFTGQYAMTRLLQELGVVPRVVLGHGTGEVIAAITAGVCSLEGGLRIVLAQQLRSRGRTAEPLLDQLALSAPGRTWISGVTGELMSPRQAPAATYWSDQFGRAPEPDRGLEALSARDCDMTLVIGRSRSAAATRLLAPLDPWGERPEARREALLRTLARLYAHGADLEWSALFGHQRQRLELPTYPFQRARCWPEPSELRSFGRDD